MSGAFFKIVTRSRSRARSSRTAWSPSRPRTWTSGRWRSGCCSTTARIWSASGPASRTGCGGICLSCAPSSKPSSSAARCRSCERWSAWTGGYGSSRRAGGCGSRARARAHPGAHPPGRPARTGAARADPRLPAGPAGRAGLRSADRGTADRPHRRGAAVPLRCLLRSPVGQRTDPVLLGEHVQHRLDRGGDRQLNRALHTIAITRAQRDPATKEYLARKEADGKTKKGALRCLKRYLAAPLLPPALRAATTRRTTYQRRAGPAASPAPRRLGGRRVARHVALGSADRDPRTSSPEAADPAHQRRTEPDDLYRLATRDSITVSLPAGG